MPRSPWVFPVSLAATSLVLALAVPACTCSEKHAKPDAGPTGTPVGPSALLTRFDALAPGAVSGYRPRVLQRLGVAKPVLHDMVVPMPAGLSVHVTWETRDDLLFVRRYLTLWKVTVDAISLGTSCVVSRTEPAVPTPTDGSIESLRVTLSIDYVCTQGRSSSSLGLVIGRLDEQGFTSVGFATGQQKAPTDSDPPALAAVHFKPKSAELDAAAQAVIDEHVKVLGADSELGLCFGFRGSKELDALQTKRREAVRKVFLDRGITRTRVNEFVGTGQAPPADDDLELYPFDKTCVVTSTTAKRR